MVDKPQWPLNSEVLRNYTHYMENELGHNYMNTSFTGATSASTELNNEEQDSEKDECCGSGCGCHD